MLTPEELQREREHRVALESTRADLMGGNEERTDKIAALERGQADLQNLLSMVLGHSECACEACVKAWNQFKAPGRIRRSITTGVQHFNGT